jgi:glycosyltransferase involved in cell wall biosynthesis
VLQESLMKIAYLGSKGLPSKSGTERVVEAITNGLSGKHEITVYCDSRYTPKGTEVEGIHLIRVFTPKGKRLQATSLFIASAIHSLINKYDLIHVHGVDTCFVLPILRLKYRVVATSHGAPGRLTPNKWGKVDRFLIRLMELPFVYLSNITTSVSQPDADYLNARYHRNVMYVPNGVSGSVKPNIDRAEEKLIQLGITPGNYLLFSAGRIDPIKGCHLLLGAVNRLKKTIKLVIIGDLNQVPSYSDHLRKIADEKQVVFIPPIQDRELLFGMVKLARVFVFPSIHESTSMMLLEAASLQTPIVCSDIPENRAIMHENVLYFRSEDEQDLADKLKWALDHPCEMSSLGTKASEDVQDNFSWENITRQYEEIYKALIQ